MTKHDSIVDHLPGVKVCGITTASDARLALDSGADMLGLNFYPPSPRYVTLDAAAEIRREVGGEAVLVGVFVDPSTSELEAAIAAAQLDLVQFHGNESRESVQPYLARAIKALRLPKELEAAEIEECIRGWSECWAVLVDTPHETLFGGSGESWDYGRLASVTSNQRLFVAGGVTPENTGELLAGLPGIFAIDLCSGVEAEPGRKDPNKLTRLMDVVTRFRTEQNQQH